MKKNKVCTTNRKISVSVTALIGLFGLSLTACNGSGSSSNSSGAMSNS